MSGAIDAGGHGDAGFIMLDALLATALVALAGTTIVTIAIQLFQQQDAALDRSVAIVMSQSLMHQYLAFGLANGAPVEIDDERYSYRVVKDGTPVAGTRLLETIAIVAQPKGEVRSVSERLEFLAPIAGASP